MNYYEIEGGRPLKGRVKVAGAKNAATKQIVASLLTEEEVILHNVPRIGDKLCLLDKIEVFGIDYREAALSSDFLDFHRVDEFTPLREASCEIDLAAAIAGAHSRHQALPHRPCDRHDEVGRRESVIG